MHNYQVKAGVALPKKKYIPGYGMVVISSDMSDAQAEAIMATGHGDFFEKVEAPQPAPIEAEAEQETEQSIEQPEAIVSQSNKKKNGKAK